ncbi:MAG TPA: sulfite exporter TauE/SafE family protein [Candidatus Methylomirabilis sp.]|nr:sulfite exporter TauE/SafE family protein [Candidatus Methylomirabilis sp.]
MELLVVLLVGLVAGTISGIVGFGSSIMLMPVLVLVFGPLRAVPIMAIAAILANLSRILVWWREVDWRAAGAYSATAVPAAALGARALLSLPPSLVEGALGAFFLLMIPARRWLAAHGVKLGLAHLAAIGAVVGFLTGIVATTGPITAPIFLATGLARGAFLSTEAAGSLAVYLSKAAVFRRYGALPFETIAEGLTSGASLMVGSLIARRFVLRMDAQRFRLLMDGLMLVSGATMLWAAATR